MPYALILVILLLSGCQGIETVTNCNHLETVTNRHESESVSYDPWNYPKCKKLFEIKIK